MKKEENIIEDLTPKNKDNEENRTNQDINLEDSLAASPNKSEENLTNSVVNEEKNKVQKSIVEIGSKYKLWIGYINLNNFKRKSEIISKPKKFEVTNKGILLVTGHGKFYIKNGDKNLRYKDRKKHYFYFHDGKVEEVGRKKFRELAKSKVW
ncbi:MAG: hypothetical protein GXO02_05420 [Epsilonproteobacteria bacterium]|nr:hypothetical protein [Campylobacterota bacterium]